MTDAFAQMLLQETQFNRMSAQNPHHNGVKMLAQGLKPMIVAVGSNLQLVWGTLKDGKLTPFMVAAKNAQGIDGFNTVPLELAFVGSTNKVQLSAMGNIRHEGSPAFVPSDLEQIEGSHSLVQCKLLAWSSDPDTDPETNEAVTGFSKSKAKQGMTLVAGVGDEFGARTSLKTILGKGGLVMEALAYFVSQPENRATLTERFSNIARSYTSDQGSSIFRAVMDDLTSKSNGYHFGYEGRSVGSDEGPMTLPVYGNMFFESVRKDKDGKRVKPDNDQYLKPYYDSTGGLATVLKRISPRATYRYMKKTDVTGREIGHNAGDQLRLHQLNHPLVALVLKVRIFFNTYNSFTLDCEPDHSGVKILYDGDDFTPSQVATFEEWKRTGAAPPRHQVNIAMTSDLSDVVALAASSDMTLRREAFYAARKQEAPMLSLMGIAREEVDNLFRDLDEESEPDSPLSPKKKAKLA